MPFRASRNDFARHADHIQPYRVSKHILLILVLQILFCTKTDEDLEFPRETWPSLHNYDTDIVNVTLVEFLVIVFFILEHIIITVLRNNSIMRMKIKVLTT